MDGMLVQQRLANQLRLDTIDQEGEGREQLCMSV
jgi:hypothetical protein